MVNRLTLFYKNIRKSKRENLKNQKAIFVHLFRILFPERENSKNNIPKAI